MAPYKAKNPEDKRFLRDKGRTKTKIKKFIDTELELMEELNGIDVRNDPRLLQLPEIQR